ncbi:adhesion G-protein coupled receptor G5 isoform X1 [Pelodiscus sinensis]|uniref:adhesion G-protein coupled receptor G5 isoform X1 n=1 Tax=Pelodiscus sinensis TaxID=13735 RepID=UPI003F6CCA59
MSYLWSTVGWDSPLRTCLFLYLLLHSAAEPGESCRFATSQPGMEVLKDNLTVMNNHLEKGCSARSQKPLEDLKQIEENLLNVSFQENFTIVCPEIQTLVFNIMPTNFQGLNISSNMTELSKGRRSKTRHAMRFPAELGKKTRNAAETRLTCIYLKGSCLFQDEKNSSLLNDDILGATLGGATVTNLSHAVEIQFWHDLVLDNSNATCVFWVEGTGGRGLGHWSSAGCETVHNARTVLCMCRHLTYFAVLLKISSAAIDKDLLAPLTYISIVGCSISAAASLLTVLFYLASRKRSSDYTTKIHMNLLGALFLLNVSFLLSEPLASVGSTWLCCGTAAFLHYSLLCSLTWMAIEGFHLYLLVIKVYNVYFRRYVLKLCAVGWGLPALPVLSILIKSGIYGKYDIRTETGYNNATMCWITDLGVHYALAPGYAGLTVLFNMVILVAVVRLLRLWRSNVENQKARVKKDLWTVLGLTCLLGTTWALAFLGFGVLLVPQLFLFSIINSLQGFFICLWYCTARRQSDTHSSMRSSQTTK